MLEAVRCQSANWHVAVDFARVAIGTRVGAGRKWRDMFGAGSATSVPYIMRGPRVFEEVKYSGWYSTGVQKKRDHFFIRQLATNCQTRQNPPELPSACVSRIVRGGELGLPR